MAERIRWRPKKDPHEPPDYHSDDVMAVRALFAGTANDGQQKLAWAWLMYVCEEGQVTYRPDNLGGTRASAFAAGKQFVGIMLKKMLTGEVMDAIERETESEAAAVRRARKEENR